MTSQPPGTWALLVKSTTNVSPEFCTFSQTNAGLAKNSPLIKRAWQAGPTRHIWCVERTLRENFSGQFLMGLCPTRKL
jgi:hypothetical protein